MEEEMMLRYLISNHVLNFDDAVHEIYKGSQALVTPGEFELRTCHRNVVTWLLMG